MAELEKEIKRTKKIIREFEEVIFFSSPINDLNLIKVLRAQKEKLKKLKGKLNSSLLEEANSY